MKKIFAVWLLLIFADRKLYAHTSKKYKIVQDYLISQTLYPQAWSYLQNFKQKYAHCFPRRPIKFHMIDQEGSPYCIGYTIVLPQSWVEELNESYTETELCAEWVLLHELAHARHSDSIKSGLMFGISMPKLLQLVIVRYGMEARADRFANRYCTNPHAMRAAIRYFQEYARNGLSHPTINSRIKKLNLAIARLENNSTGCALAL